jgi:hypothetical protein
MSLQSAQERAVRGPPQPHGVVRRPRGQQGRSSAAPVPIGGKDHTLSEHLPDTEQIRQQNVCLTNTPEIDNILLSTRH